MAVEVMGDKTDNLLISISTDLSTIKRNLKQPMGDLGQQFDRLGKGIDPSSTPMQKRINEIVGLPFAPK
ncbi:hypothetical protein [Mesorhizobium sp. ES1-3]|uniref:hypothetical protein n=1 Tax=Mesorhizobium sp. ES1-3 TaxID=2876628 RepID=UPI001CCA469B|nr:hypothetical protein [Mesorhizobium sp. ES1-3]MBZ9668560.1 hypothetical protein [Mesorhizobium sp. ES1-3]